MRVLAAVALALLVVAVPVAAQDKTDPDPPTVSNPVSPFATGGPDAFGYTFADQDEPNCAFQYVDISGTGADQALGDDAAATIALAVPFDFYGNMQNTVDVGSNGYLTFGTDGTDFTNDCPAPDAIDPNDLIAGVWDDWSPNISGAVLWEYFAACPRPGRFAAIPGCNVFQWADVPPFGGGAGDSIDFQVIMYDSWDITVQVDDVQGGVDGDSTTALEDPTAADGLTYQCDAGAGAMSPGTAVCFFHPNAVPVELESVSVE